MKTRLHIQKKTPTTSTHTPISNPFQPRGFGMDENSQQSTYSPQEVDLDVQYNNAKRMRRNSDEISVYPPDKEPHINVKAKLSIGQRNDKYEQEADQVADKVVQKMNASDSDIQKEAAPEEEEIQMKSLIQRQAAPEEEEIQTKGENNKNPANEKFEQSLKSSKGGGQPLTDNVRQPMEKAFGTDFSGVKIHTDSTSHELNQRIQARAFTTGEDVFFRSGEYNPTSKDGQHLLAHELTHVVQQNGGAIQRKVKTGTSRTLDFITMKRKHIQLTGDDKYGHWWTEIDSNESYGWWPKYPVGGIKETLFGVDGELNGVTSFGGSATKDPHHGDSAPDVFHPVYTGSKTDAQIKANIRSFASSYSGKWRWTFGFGQNCHTFQESLMKSVGMKQS